MKDKVIRYIVENNLFSQEDKLIVAISGGADSVALAMILFDAGYNISFAHCNFNLRREESQKDEEFVKLLSVKLGLKYYVKSFQTLEYANKNKISIQMAARDLRYKWFSELIKETNSQYIVLGHHLGDDIETFFINLIRGTGIKGLLGMKPKINNIVRPFLSFSRMEIESYLHEINQDFREDASNKNVKYLRNNIRENLLPIIKEMNPSFSSTFVNEIEYLNQIYNVYKDHIDPIKKRIMNTVDDKISISKKELLSETHHKAILREILVHYGFNEIDKILTSCRSSSSGKIFYSHHYMLLLDRDNIFIKKKESSYKDVRINIDQKYIDYPLKIRFRVDDKIDINTNRNLAIIDYEKITFPLSIRKWRQGDVFFPLGMNHKKKISDFFIDNKFSIFDKQDCWLLCSGDKIVWIIGYRIDDRFKISKNSKKAYIAELI